MNPNVIPYYALLASKSGDYLRQTLKEWTRDQLLEIIRLAHSQVDQGCVLFGEVQPLIQICAELALSCVPGTCDDFSPPFSADQVESLVWLLEDDPSCFCEHYSVCTPAKACGMYSVSTDPCQIGSM